MSGKWKGLFQKIKTEYLYLAYLTRKPQGMLALSLMIPNTAEKRWCCRLCTCPLQHHFGNAYFFNNRFIADRS